MSGREPEAEKLLCVMAGYDGETERRVEALRQNLVEAGYVGRQTPDIPHHITLGSFGPSEEERVEALAGKAAAEIRSFPVTFNHIGVFGGSQVLFLAPDPNRELLALREMFGDSWNWTPHTTLLIDEPARLFQAAPLAAGSFQAFSGRVEALLFYEFWPARPISVLPLQN